MSCTSWLRLSPTYWWCSNRARRSIDGRPYADAERGAETAPRSHRKFCTGKEPVDVWSAGRDEAPAAITGGFWLGFTRWSSGQLVASHLRSPALFTCQLDHLLSSVVSVNHTRG